MHDVPDALSRRHKDEEHIETIEDTTDKWYTYKKTQKDNMENTQPRIPALMTLRLTRPTTTNTNTERTPLLQTPGQAPHPHRYGRDGTHQTETRRTLLPTPTTHIQVTKTATTTTHITTTAPTATQKHSQTHTHMTTHQLHSPDQGNAQNATGWSGTLNTHNTYKPAHKLTQTHNTQHKLSHTHQQSPKPHEPQPRTRLHTHLPRNKHPTHPTSTPTPRHTPPPASPALWTRTRLTRPQTTEDRILQTFANMDTRTEPTQTRQTYKKHIGPPLEIISIIANLQATNTLDDELRAQRDRYMTRRAHQHTNTDETEASTSTHQPHTTHQTAPHKTQPSNTPDTDTDTDSTTSTAETVIHIETTHTTTPKTQTTDDDTDNNTDTTSLTDTDEHTQTPQPITHTTRDSRRYKKRKTIQPRRSNHEPQEIRSNAKTHQDPHRREPPYQNQKLKHK
ncbi:mucin-5AC-like [Neodiprion fabricii]|uniref:mucin-5AC-like n=1 Tax=Neodiprion fabricii TaxID=2872261 RepID=UPI001ED90F53|nr:mucin-5AC-like [Neodiprion fabricii]